MSGSPGSGGSNPRKFSEKIALHNQKQAEETLAFDQLMTDLTVSRVSRSLSINIELLSVIYLCMSGLKLDRNAMFSLIKEVGQASQQGVNALCCQAAGHLSNLCHNSLRLWFGRLLRNKASCLTK